MKKLLALQVAFFFLFKFILKIIMKNQKALHIPYLEYTKDQLSSEDALLYKMAQEATLKAYAPYSNFYVGCALKLKNGEIITGTNQENAAFPSGLCAERVAFFYAGANFPNELIDTIVISVSSSKKHSDLIYAPCAACRQSMLEYENKQQQPIRILFEGSNDTIIEMNAINDLIPFAFILDK